MANLPKIVFVSNSCWNLYNFRKPLITHFLACGFDVECIGRSDIGDEKLRNLGCFVISYESTTSCVWTLIKIILCSDKRIFLGFTHIPNFILCFLKYFTGIPVLSTITGMGFLHEPSSFTKTKALRFLLAWQVRADFVFVHNEDDLRIVNSIASSQSNSVCVAGSGVDLRRFSGWGLTLTPLKDRREIIMVSRLLVKKGVLDFFECASLLKEWSLVHNFRFVVYGRATQGYSRGGLGEAQLYKQFGDIVEFRELELEKSAIFRRARLVVLPSYREGMPLSLMEAAACGVPVVTTDVPGCRQLFSNFVFGKLVAAGSPEQLSEAIRQLCSSDESEYRRLSAEARKAAVRDFDANNVVRVYHDRVIDLVASGS